MSTATVLKLAMSAFLDQMRVRDDVRSALALKLLDAETHHRPDAEAALADGPGAACR